jgi:hypothetical protein
MGVGRLIAGLVRLGKKVRCHCVEMDEAWPARIEASQKILYYTEEGIKASNGR